MIRKHEKLYKINQLTWKSSIQVICGTHLLHIKIKFLLFQLQRIIFCKTTAKGGKDKWTLWISKITINKVASITSKLIHLQDEEVEKEKKKKKITVLHFQDGYVRV